MNDLIDRQAAIDALTHKWDGMVTSVFDLIKELPSAEQERRGRWIHPYEYGLALPEHKCSVCGEWEYADSESNYCPNCGAYMRGKK